MTNISIHDTQSKEYQKAYDQLQAVISQLNKSQSTLFFETLFTNSEKVMFVKRLAAIILFDQSHGPYKVAHTISLSVSTTQRLYTQYETGQYDELLACIPKQQKSVFLEILQDIVLSRVSFRARQRLLKRLPR